MMKGNQDNLRPPAGEATDLGPLTALVNQVIVDTEHIQTVLIGMVGDIYRQKNELPEWVPDGGSMVFSIGLALVPSGVPVATGDITAGDIDVVRIRAGAETVIENGVTLTVEDGVLFHIIDTDTADWQADDDIKIVQDTISQITVAAVNYPITFAPQICRVSDLGDYGEQLQAINDIVSAMLELMQTGNTLTADGTEQDVYVEDTPAGVMNTGYVKINLDNMADGDRIVVTEYSKDTAGGGWVEEDSNIYEDADGGLEDDSTKITIQIPPNRHGWKVTLDQEIGTFRDYPYEAYREA